jgi:hypothetical protein
VLDRWMDLPARLLTGVRARVTLAWIPDPSSVPTPASTCGGGQISVDVRDGANAPGLAGLQHVTNIVAAFTLVGCALAILVGIFVATSGRIADQRASVTGRLMVFGGLAGAFGIGLVAALVNFAYTTGQASC